MLVCNDFLGMQADNCTVLKHLSYTMVCMHSAVDKLLISWIMKRGVQEPSQDSDEVKA